MTSREDLLISVDYQPMYGCRTFLLLVTVACFGCAGEQESSGVPLSDAGTIDANIETDGVIGITPDLGQNVDGSIPRAFVPVPAGMYRLTQSQLRNIIADVFGPEITIRTELEEDTQIHGFASIGGSELTISALAVEQFERAALEVADQVFSDPDRRAEWFACDVPTEDQRCLREGLRGLGYRLWRRPISEDELTRLTELSAILMDQLRDEWLAVRYTVSALLQSPHFLFRVERGEDVPERPGQLRFTDYEMASRLSFLFWNQGPDLDLLERAERGELSTLDGVRAAAVRLAGHPKTRSGSLAFFREYLLLDRLDALQKDRQLFPLMSDALGAQMREEIERLIERVVFDESDDVHTLLTTRRTEINGALASIYQVPGVREWTDFEFPENSPRSGLLTTAGFLAMNAHSTVTSPTFRGKYIQNKMFCFDVPPPPPGVVASLELVESEGPVTTREKLAQHRADPSCAGCHIFMDPLGLSLENFDPIGMWRTTENGLPIDASGELNGEAFVGGKALGHLVARQQTFGECVTRQLYRHTMGHLETPGEEVAVTALQGRFREMDFRFDQLLIALATSEAFRRPGAPE